MQITAAELELFRRSAWEAPMKQPPLLVVSLEEDDDPLF